MTDNPYMPMPVSDGVSPDARVLAVALAIEAVNMVLPPIRAVHPERILEAREGLKEELVPFRAQMLRLSAELHQAIGSGARPDELRREAKFLVETRVLPELELFKARVEDKRGIWRDRLLDLAMAAPEIAHYFSSMEPLAAVGKSIEKLMEVVQKLRGEADEARREAREMGLTYLVKLPRTMGA